MAGTNLHEDLLALKEERVQYEETLDRCDGNDAVYRHCIHTLHCLDEQIKKLKEEMKLGSI